MTQYEIIALDRGYRVDTLGIVYNSKGKIVTGTLRKGYKCICFKIDKKDKKIYVHRIQAYQKFGDKIYIEGFEVRHLDGNRLNNSWNNIEIGTSSENSMDVPKEIRIKNGSNSIKYSNDLVAQIKEYRALGHTYIEIMEKFNIPNKGTVSYIINKRQ